MSGTRAGAQKREANGCHTPVPDDELIELVRALGRTTASELGEVAGIAHITACTRLRYLYERGVLVRVKQQMRFSRGRRSWVYEAKEVKP
jgi:predicted transcriptional regulator